jgi:flagellar hook-associated protein 3 FlgL
MMRISFNMQFKQSLNGILDAQKKMSRAEEQLVKQTRILSPADDPAASAKVLGLDQNLAQIEQYQKNSVLLKNNLALEETVLTNMRTAYDRISTLAQAAGNGTYGPSERDALALELRNIQAEMFDAMNTTNADGSYIFAGYQARTAAYEKDPVSGDYQFKGDDGFRALQISPSIKMQGNDSGKAIFDDVFARFKPTAATIISGTPSAVNIEVSAQNKFNAFYSSSYDGLNAANNTYNIAIDAANNYQILQNGTALSPAVTGTFVPGEDIEFQGLAIKIDGAAAAPGQIDFSLPAPVKKNILNTLNDFIKVLENPTASSAAISEAIGDALAQTEASARRIDSTLSNIGGRNNVLDSVFNNNEDLTIKNKEYRADLAEVDFAAAMTEIKRQEVAMQAASSTFGKMAASTLFDYIR